MPNLIEIKRKVAQDQINFNPFEITFTRETKTINETTGSLTTNTSSYTEIVRITKTNNQKSIIGQDIGIEIKKEGYLILGNYNSNMKCNKFITDSFELDDKKYRITSVMNNEEKGSTTSVQAIAEVVDKWQT